MIGVHAFRDGQELADVPVDDLSEVGAGTGTLVWVDLAGPSAEELDRVGQALSVPLPVLQACRLRSQRPKVVEYADHVLLVAYGISPSGDDGPARLWEVDLVVGERVDNLEDAVFAGRSQEVQAEIFRLRKELAAVRRVAAPARDALLPLVRADLSPFDREVQRHLRDVLDRLAHIVDSAEDYQDLAGSALGANLAFISNRVNEVARTLAAYASIFAAITVITGVYGMNFEHMPELGWLLGYPFALGIMLAAAVGLWAYFKRKGWL